MRTFDYLTLDVFTDKKFGGNPLAVIPEADGLGDAEMQAIAAEFNYSETTFVLPTEANLGPRVRIFTPRAELPFAGHPTIGTAIALRHLGQLTQNRIVLEQTAGPVPVEFQGDGSARFEAPGKAFLASKGSRDEAAKALGLEVSSIAAEPMQAGAGLAFPFVELSDLEALANARLTPCGTVFDDELVCFVRLNPAELRARVFAPGHGIPEDPATGSAAAGLAVLLASESPIDDGRLQWQIDQGIEMGRPSRILIEADKQDGKVRSVFVSGHAVWVCEGRIRL